MTNTARKSSRRRWRREKLRRHIATRWRPIWQAFAKKLELTNDDFVRTTELRHKQVVQAIFSKLHDDGHFYKEVTGILFREGGNFPHEKDRRADGTFDPAYGEVVELHEENYYFRLGRTSNG